MWSFGARAAQSTEALQLDVADLQEAAERDPAFGYAVVRAMSGLLLDRLQATRARLLDLYANPGASSVTAPSSASIPTATGWCAGPSRRTTRSRSN